MWIPLPEIPEDERTPLVQQLLDIIALQQERIQRLEERIQQLEGEIARLKGLKTRPRIAPASWRGRVGRPATSMPNGPAPPNAPRQPS